MKRVAIVTDIASGKPRITTTTINHKVYNQYISDNVPKAEAPAAINEHRKAAVFIVSVLVMWGVRCG